MKTIILAGGLGTRLSVETADKPKPMVEIGQQPMLWHIMNIYAKYGFQEFVLALGYKAKVIKEYFLQFHAQNNDLTVDLRSGEVTIQAGQVPNWKVHLVDTGADTQTGGRLKRLQPWIGEETFMLTYGDGVSNVNIPELVAFHKSHGKLATLTAVCSPARFGSLYTEGDKISEFNEKPQFGEGCINGGFFVLEPAVFKYLDDDQTVWEEKPLSQLATDGQLMAYQHNGFWQSMDTLKEKQLLESLWESGDAPWKIWS